MNNDVLGLLPPLADLKAQLPSVMLPKVKLPSVYLPGAGSYSVKQRLYQQKQAQLERESHHVKGLGDILLGHPLTGTKNLQTTLEDNNLEVIKNIPVINRLAGLAVTINNDFINPLLSKGLDGAPEVGLNLLSFAGDTLDIAANPIKALMPWAGGGELDDFMKSMGWMENEYRAQYQWDSGNIVVDLVGEILSDPLTFVTLGASGAAKGFAKAGIKATAEAYAPAIKNAAAKLGLNFSDDVAMVYAARTIREMQAKPNMLIEDILNKVMRDEDTINRVEGVLRSTRKDLNETQIKTFTKTLTDPANKAIFGNTVADLKAMSRESFYKQYKTISTILKPGVKMDEMLINSIKTLTPIGWAGMTAKMFAKPTFNAMWNASKYNKPLANIVSDLNNSPAALHRVDTNLIETHKKIHTDLYTRYDKALVNRNYSLEQTLKLARQVMQSIPATKLSTETFRQVFLKALDSKVNVGDFVKLDQELLEEITDVVAEYSFASLLKEKEMITATRQLINNDLDNIFGKGTSARIAERNPKEVLEYIDKYWLSIDGKHYGLENFDEFLKALRNKDFQNYTTKNAVLKYYGISIESAPKMARLLKVNTAESVKEVENLIKQYRLDERPVATASPKKVNKIIKDSTDFEMSKVVGDSEYAKRVDAARIPVDIDLVEVTKKQKAILKELAPVLKRVNEIIAAKTGLFKRVNTYDALKQIFTEVGISTPRVDEALEYLKTTDLVKLPIEEYSVFITNLRIVRTQVQKISRQNPSNNPRLSAFIHTVATDVNIELSKILDGNTFENITDFISYTDSYYRQIVSQRGVYGMINQQVFNNASGRYKEFITALKAKNSVLRSRLAELSEILLGSQSTVQASHAIKQLILTTDTHTAVNRILSTSIDGKNIVLTDKIQDYIRELIVNKISSRKYRDMYAVYVRDSAPKIAEDIVVNELFRDYRVDLHRLIEGSGSSVQLEQEYITRIVEDTLYTYFDEILESGSSLGLDVRVFNVFQSDTHDLLQTLGGLRPEVFKVLEESNAPLKYKSDYDTALEYYLEQTNMSEILTELETFNGDFFKTNAVTKNPIVKEAQENMILDTMKTLDANYKENSSTSILANMYSYSSLTKAAREGNAQAGMFQMSVEGKIRSFEKLFDIKKAEQWKIKETDLDLNNGRYFEFYQKFHNARAIADNELSLNRTPSNLVNTVEILKEVYNRPGAMYAPKNVVEYFDNMLETDPQGIIAWDLVTKYGINTENKILYTKIKTKRLEELGLAQDHIRQYIDQDNYYKELLALDATDPFMEKSAVSKIMEESDIPQVIEECLIKLDEHMDAAFKSLESMQAHQIQFNEFVRTNRQAINNLKPMLGVYEFSRKNIAPKISKTNKVKLNVAGVTINEHTFKQSNVYKYMQDERIDALKESIVRLNAKQLRTYIDKNTDGAMMFLDESSEQILFNFTEQELAEAGLVIVKQVEEDIDVYMIRRVNKEMTNHPFSYVTYDTPFEEAHTVYNEVIEKNRNFMNLNGMNLPNELLTGQRMDLDLWTAIQADPKFRAFFGDLEIRKSYQKLNSRETSSFFTRNYSRPNSAIIGNAKAFNKLVDLVKDSSKKLGLESRYTTSRLDKSIHLGMVDSISRADGINKYLTMFMNDDYYVGNPMFKQMFEGKTDREIKDFFDSGYRAVILRQDRYGKARVHHVYINTQKDLQKAIDNKAIIVPGEVYKNMVMTVNQDLYDDALSKMFKSYVAPLYKTIWLTSPGFLFRNAFDALFYKNNNELGRYGKSIVDVVKYEMQASKMLKWYDDILKQALELSDPLNRTLNKTNLMEVLKKLSIQERQAFFMIQLFMESSASGGYAKSLQDFLLQRNKQFSEDPTPLIQEFLNEKILNNEALPTGMIMNATNWVEQTSRFGLFLGLVDSGVPYSKAIQDVIKTHFDYNLKTDAEQMIEHLFWFSTFGINNTMYYLNGGLARNRILYKSLLDAYELSWNDGNYTWDNINKSNYLKYHALAGNLRIEFGGKEYVLKLGSSVFDFFATFVDPVGSAIGRVNPFLSTAVGLEELDQLNPISGQMNRVGMIGSGPGKGFVPSIYTEMYAYDFNKRFPNRRSFYYPRTKYYNRRPKRIRKPNLRGRRYYRIYHDRFKSYQMNNRFNWMIATKGIEPWFNNETNRAKSGIDKIIRTTRKFKMPEANYYDK